MSERLLSIDVQCTGEEVRLALRGELDISTAPTLETCLEGIDAAVARVVLDLRDLRFMDSSGIRVVAMANQDGKAVGRTVAIANPSGHIANLISITGLDTVLPVIDA